MPVIFLLLACADPPEAPGCGDPGILCTVAGTGTSGFNGDGLDGQESWLYWPSALGFDLGGDLSIVDFNNMRVRTLGDDGKLRTLAGSGFHGGAIAGTDALETPLENPVDIAFGPDGSVYIAELHVARVVRVTPEGVVDLFAGTGEVGFSGDGGPAVEADMSEIAGLAMGDDGTLYIADTQNHCLRAVDEDGTIRTLGGVGLPGFLGDGGDIAGAMFHSPERMAVYDGYLYLADSGNNAIRRIDLESGYLETVAGTGLSGYDGDGGLATEAALSAPFGLWVDARGLWIADTGNHSVRYVDPDGNISTVVGTGETAGFDPEGEGKPAKEVRLSYPVDVAVDAGGNLFLADMAHSVVRMVGG